MPFRKTCFSAFFVLNSVTIALSSPFPLRRFCPLPPGSSFFVPAMCPPGSRSQSDGVFRRRHRGLGRVRRARVPFSPFSPFFEPAVVAWDFSISLGFPAPVVLNIVFAVCVSAFSPRDFSICVMGPLRVLVLSWGFSLWGCQDFLTWGFSDHELGY